MHAREPIPLAMLNALAYCPRRFVYEHVQGEMLLNEHVVEGALLHAGIDLGGTVWEGERVQQRRVYVWSERLGLVGFCDLVETQTGAIYPVEYKKGRPRRWFNDHAQLCAQALCLEERLGITIPRGAIFYFAARRREVVEFTATLRAEVEALVAQAHALALAGRLPPPIEQRARCRECSLEPLCLPDEVEQLAQEHAIPAWEESEL
ncbi:CRISPR-associated protein Cas4 [Kallotenue papyrolyticum]|uniref:CRISPR-associated protein Cas4 n=1 Tax=Kallotenue papyrolyticum TaxID=1325125 RepID=UPI0004928C84|nr:CRISPR-associated protein Cas4 [Kallotenue papyrolyticum]